MGDPIPLAIGDYCELTRTITATDVHTFADVTGDQNPVHRTPSPPEAKAALQPFGGRPIAHGMLTAR
jgi:3-hydroxybutyryl-CoA dehydratase